MPTCSACGETDPLAFYPSARTASVRKCRKCQQQARNARERAHREAVEPGSCFVCGEHRKRNSTGAAFCPACLHRRARNAQIVVSDRSITHTNNYDDIDVIQIVSARRPIVTDGYLSPYLSRAERARQQHAARLQGDDDDD